MLSTHGSRKGDPSTSGKNQQAEVRADEPVLANDSRFAFSSLRAFSNIVLVFALSRGLGLLRETGIAAYFGTSANADRIAAAFVISSFATITISEAIGAAAIRRLSDDRASGRALLAWTNRWTPAALLAYASVSAPLAALLTSRDGEDWWLGPALALALTPCVATAMLSAVGGALLTLEGRIGRVLASQACWSAGALIGVVAVAAGWHSPLPVILGWSAGNIVGLVVIRTAVDLSGPRVSINPRAMLGPSLAIASAYSLLAGQGIMDRLIASRLETGAIAALGYADRLYLVPVGFILAAYGPAVLGDLMNQRRDVTSRASQSALHLHSLVRVAAPCALVGIAFTPPMMHAVFGYGAFGERSQMLTLGALDGLMCGVVATSLSLALLRVTQALGSPRHLPIVTSISVVINALVSVGLSLEFGIAGVALGTSVTALITAALQMMLLEHSLGRRWLLTVVESCLLPAGVVLLTGAYVTVLAYQGSLGSTQRIGICIVGMLVLLVVMRVKIFRPYTS